ncbi:MAG TPA: hypothetical protein VF771_06980 [Longimicrobiaceae bacterium]
MFGELLELGFELVGDTLLHGTGELLIPNRVGGRALAVAWALIAATGAGVWAWFGHHPASSTVRWLAAIACVGLGIYGVILTVVWWMGRVEARRLEAAVRRP